MSKPNSPDPARQVAKEGKTMTECKMYGCHKQAVIAVDIWGFCEPHADEYRKRFADALKEQQQKRSKSKGRGIDNDKLG